MDADTTHWPHTGNTRRSSNGCWTCRLRRKKCDELHPICATCSSLRITCYYGENKPEWMNGGLKQEEMAEILKSEVKERARHRYEIRPTKDSGDHHMFVNGSRPQIFDQRIFRNHATSIKEICGTNPHPRSGEMELHEGNMDQSRCKNMGNNAGSVAGFQKSDSLLVLFYLEHVLPFLFPFYNPSLLQGGKAWVLDLLVTSPVYRQASLCQSSYFFSLAGSLPVGNVLFERVLRQTRDAFEVLRQALAVIDGPKISEHLHGAVRILASILQLQRFETTILSFDNCQSHLNAARALFQQLLDSSEAVNSLTARFHDVMNRLGPSPWKLPSQCMKVPSAEQAAFRFSTAQLIVDDIIASTALQVRPRLYDHHKDMLGREGNDLAINLEETIGCQNWAMIGIGEIAALDAWKQRCKTSGNLDMMELVSHATVIKDSLQDHLMELKTEQGVFLGHTNSALDAFTADYGQRPQVPLCQVSVVTRVWSHAALIYLSIVVSGWQPANTDIRYHVSQVFELLTHQLSLPTLIRTMAWPFCVAGCLAEAEYESCFRGMVEPLQPSSVFGTVRKALEIMEKVWKSRGENFKAELDLATCFRSQGELVLLV